MVQIRQGFAGVSADDQTRIGFCGQAMYKFNTKVRAAGSGIIRRECVSSTDLSGSETVPQNALIKGNLNQDTKSAVWVWNSNNPTFKWSTSLVSPSKSRFLFSEIGSLCNGLGMDL